MQHKQTMAALLIAVAGVTAASAVPMTVVTTSNPNTLAGTILGGGISLVGTPVYTGAAGAAGTFTGGAGAGITINNGIVLTTGRAAFAGEFNTSDSRTRDNGLGGHSAISGSLDATSLKFDFTSAGGDVFFNYVFASEEYNEFANTEFNDAFVFLLDGVNIALIPSTSTPVSINTVNGGDPFGFGAVNPAFYNNNDLDDGGPFFDIQYDGFTDVFTASTLGLSAGTHTIELIIADRGDGDYDSAVFLQANSFAGVPTDPNTVPETGNVFWIGLVSLLAFGAWVRRSHEPATK